MIFAYKMECKIVLKARTQTHVFQLILDGVKLFLLHFFFVAESHGVDERLEPFVILALIQVSI